MGNFNNKLHFASYSKIYKPTNRDIHTTPIGFIKYLIGGDITRIETFDRNKDNITINQLDKTDYFLKNKDYDRANKLLGIDLSIYSKKSLDLIGINKDYKTPNPLKLFIFCDVCDKGIIYDDPGCQKCFESDCIKCDKNSKPCLHCGIVCHRVRTIFVPDIKESLACVLKRDEAHGFHWAISWVNTIKIIPKKIIKKLNPDDDDLTALYPHLYAIIIKDRDVCLIYNGDDYNIEPLMSIVRAGNGLCAIDHNSFYNPIHPYYYDNKKE